MRKLLMTGAAFVLLTGMGMTAVAAGPNLFASGTMKPGIVRQHHMNDLQGHVGRHSCTAAVSFDGFACLPETYRVQHTEAEAFDWTGTQISAAVYTDWAGNCHISDGYCTSWSDGDGDGVCDLCRNPSYGENSAVSGAGAGCQVSGGYCMSWSDGDGDGVCDLCRNPSYRENSAVSEAGAGCHVSGGYCTSWNDTDGDGICDLCRNVVSSLNNDGASGSQAQNDGGYVSGCYGSGDNGCGNGRQGHHGSGHHGTGHHR